MNSLTEKSPKSPQIYNCLCCDLHTRNRKDFVKHLLTRKHQKKNSLTNSDISLTDLSHDDIANHICSACAKEYKSRVGLWYHMKTCISI